MHKLENFSYTKCVFNKFFGPEVMDRGGGRGLSVSNQSYGAGQLLFRAAARVPKIVTLM